MDMQERVARLTVQARSTKPTCVRLPDALIWRAKYMIIERGLRGGVTAMIIAALEAHLDALDKVPFKFETAWMRSHAGVEPTLQQKIACYGGRYETPKLRGDRMPYFDCTDVMTHFETSTWNADTARAIYVQQAEWLRRGQSLIEMPMKPPGWEGYPTEPIPPGGWRAALEATNNAHAAPRRDPAEWSLNLAACEFQVGECTHQAECTQARACVLAEAERARIEADIPEE